MHRRFATLVLSAASVAACSAQHDTTYTGEPLAVLHGTAQVLGTAQPPQLEVGLVWTPASAYPLPDGGFPPPQLDISRVSVSGQFPSAFTLNVSAPPPDDTLIECAQPGGSIADGGLEPGRFTFGYIDALSEGTDASDLLRNVYGMAFEFRVVYVDHDVTACDRLAVKMPLTRGYHLVRRIPGTCPVDDNLAQCDVFSEVPLTTPIDLSVSATPLTMGPSTEGPPGSTGNSSLTAGPNCVRGSVPTDASTGSSCRLFLLLGDVNGGPPPIDCSGQGLTPATDADVAQLLQDQPQHSSICEVTQVPPSAWIDGSCAQSSQTGWCYVSGAMAGDCANGAVFFSSSVALPQLPAGDTLNGQFICP